MGTTAHTEQTIGGAFDAGVKDGANPKPAAPASTDAGSTASSAVGNAASSVATAAGNVVGAVEEKGKGLWDSLKSMDMGQIIGGITGLFGAWFLGSFFGQGIVGTILTVCLAIPLMCMGSGQLGPLFNHWMGRDKQPNQPGGTSPQLGGQTTQVTQAQDQQQGQGTILTDNDLNTILEDARRAGKPTSTLLIGASGKEVRVNVAELQQDLAAAHSRFGANAGLSLTQDSVTHSITPMAIPLQAANSQGRGQ